MKGINKTNLCQLIMDMVISDIHIEQPISDIINADTLDGREHIINKSGEVTIHIKGRVEKPGEL